MQGRKLFSAGPVAVLIAVVALVGGCREATTGPSGQNPAAFASAINLVSGNSQVGPIRATLGQLLTVKVVDAGGLPVQGATVTFLVRTGGGAIAPATTTSNAGGLVTATWTLGGTIGPQTAVALLTGTFVTDSTKFAATATTGPGAGFVAVSGNNQVSVVGKALALPLVVKVTDAYGNNVSGTTVTWAAANLSGTVSPSTDTSGADGTASTTWTLGNTATTQIVSASVPGLQPIFFSAVASADSAHITMTAIAGANQAAGVSVALPTALAVKVTDQYGNPVVGDVVTWNASIAGGGRLSAATSITDATGTATTNWTLGGRVGAQSIQAKEGVKSLTASFAATATVAFSDVFAGNFMACGIAASNNQLYCWGVGDGGQLGKASVTNSSAPTWPVTQTDSATGPYLQVRQLSGGNDGFCALTIDRRLFCWGRNIGVSSITSNVATAQPIVLGSTSQQILPNLIAMGEQQVCLTDLTGLAFCTGTNLHAELGTGNDSTPSQGTYTWITPNPASPVTAWAKIAAGQAHGCGMPRYSPLDSLSQIPRCWGLNTSGQVGNNKTSGTNGQLLPTVILPRPAGTKFDSTSITTGAQHSCAIEASNSVTPGQAWCWGGNGFGQLGSGTVGTAIDSVPTPVAAGGVTFAKIYAGTYHTCAISTAGAAYCWGRNDYGQLGGGSAGAATATPLAVTGGLLFRSLSVGELYTCGVTGNFTDLSGPSAAPGTVYCWGNNLFGQIGNESASNTVPVLAPSKVHFQP
jgi:alpha-tubulin suppressor-like RCC1 family protein